MDASLRWHDNDIITNMSQFFPSFTLNLATFEESLKAILANNREAIAARLQQGAPYSWENFITPLEEHAQVLSKFFAPLAHLHAVKDSPEIREVYNACLPLLAEYSIEIGQNQALYAAYQSLQESQAAVLDAAQRQAIKHALRDFQLSGVALMGEARARYSAIVMELTELQNKFEQHVLDATEAFSYHTSDPAELMGLPERIKAQAEGQAKSKGETGWRLGIDQPTYIAVMQFADQRSLREKFYRAYHTRASSGPFDNTAVMGKIVAARQEEAQLLGFPNYVAYSLASKMAVSYEEITTLLSQLVAPAKAKAKADVEALRARAREEAVTSLEAWDIAYYSEKLRQEKFHLDEEALRDYFPVPKVLSGLFEILNRLYGMQVSEVHDVEVWDPAVQVFKISDAQKMLRGYVYVDLYARKGKRSGAWMDDHCDRFRRQNTLQYPIAFLSCNFDPPTENHPALLRHDDVTTLFHEFGHCLQHVLTQVDYPDVAGTHGVPWDAIELPSQFFENWCWQSEALPLLSHHYQTKAPLPENLLRQLLSAKHFQSGWQTLRQVEFALFDLRIHTACQGKSAACITETLEAVRDEVAVFKPPAWTRFAQSFSHIFAGGYAAGYYSYKWAEVLSADAFGRFLEEGIFNRETGESFLKTVLESGGSEDAMALFKAFRGREPQVAALLKQDGLL